jgi:hypothetical protein
VRVPEHADLRGVGLVANQQGNPRLSTHVRRQQHNEEKDDQRPAACVVPPSIWPPIDRALLARNNPGCHRLGTPVRRQASVLRHAISASANLHPTSRGEPCHRGASEAYEPELGSATTMAHCPCKWTAFCAGLLSCVAAIGKFDQNWPYPRAIAAAKASSGASRTASAQRYRLTLATASSVGVTHSLRHFR